MGHVIHTGQEGTEDMKISWRLVKRYLGVIEALSCKGTTEHDIQGVRSLKLRLCKVWSFVTTGQA